MKYNHKYPLSTFQNQIDIIRENGFKPIAVTQFYLEDTFVFETEEEAYKAYLKLEKSKNIIRGWWYGKDEFEQEIKQYEIDFKHKVKVFWFNNIKH